MKCKTVFCREVRTFGILVLLTIGYRIRRIGTWCEEVAENKLKKLTEDELESNIVPRA